MRQQIEQNIREWATENIGSSFVFRENQLEIIADIVENIVELTDNKTHIVEAPTGSGKSLILIISAGVLYKYYKKTSYILCSDLFLWKQYDDFLDKLPKLDTLFGRLKGQTGNYCCEKNKEDIRNAECRIARIPWSKLFNPSGNEARMFDCAKTCAYVKARHKAQKAPITLMTYQLYLYMINVVPNNVPTPPFTERDIIFCDECHNIPNIISAQYTPTVSEALLEKFETIYDYNQLQFSGLFAGDLTIYNLSQRWSTKYDLRKEFNERFNAMIQETPNEESYEQITDYITNFVNMFDSTVGLIEDNAKLLHAQGSLSTDAMTLYKTGSWFRNYCCFCNDFSEAIHSCGPEYIVKLIQEKRKSITGEIYKTVNFKCSKEDYMCYTYLMSTSQNQVLTSATIGLKESFIDNIGLKYTEYPEPKIDKLPSTFDFSKSPIFYLARYKMSYKCKDESFPKIEKLTYDIIKKHQNQRGIIQTGSYENAIKLYNDAPKEVQNRLLIYNNSGEKNDIIDFHKLNSDTVLIGPSLNEGIDLPDDMCRFIVIMKVPYPSLADELVKAKMKLFPYWYNSETSNHIIQGIGRGNRHTNDWCVTYILDGCFTALYNSTKTQYSEELQNRIKYFA